MRCTPYKSLSPGGDSRRDWPFSQRWTLWRRQTMIPSTTPFTSSWRGPVAISRALPGQGTPALSAYCPPSPEAMVAD